MKLKFDILIEQDGERFHAYCPALKGLHVDGDTVEECVKAARDAILGYLESLAKHNEPIPVGCLVRERPAVIGLRQWFADLMSHGERPLQRSLELPMPA